MVSGAGAICFFVLEPPTAVLRGPGAGEDCEFCILSVGQDEVVDALLEEDVEIVVVLLASLLNHGEAFLGDAAEGGESGGGYVGLFSLILFLF